MDAIVAVDLNWGIGCQGQLLVGIREDLKRFRELTMGKRLVYGRKTLESFPQARPLPKRQSLILTTQGDLFPELRLEDGRPQVLTFASLADLDVHLQVEPEPEVMLIGGASVYAQLLSCCRRVFVTRIHQCFEAVDAWYPNLDERAEWVLTEVSDLRHDEETGLSYQYLLYEQQV